MKNSCTATRVGFALIVFACGIANARAAEEFILDPTHTFVSQQT